MSAPGSAPSTSSSGSQAKLLSAASDLSNALNTNASGFTPASLMRSIKSRIASESPHTAYALHSVVVASRTSLGCVTAASSRATVETFPEPSPDVSGVTRA